MRISDWSSDVCSSDLEGATGFGQRIIFRIGGFLAIFRTDCEADRSARQFEKLRQIARDAGRCDELLCLFLAGRGGVDEVQSRRAGRPLAEDVDRKDRKSTRLNSSH